MLTRADKSALVTIQRDTLTYVKGVETRTPADYATAWASVQPLSGSEYWRAQQVSSRISWKVRLDYREDLLQSDRIIYGTKRLEIVAVLSDRATWETVLMCQESNG
jgi:SPP1 family predicted phage head-tail adaptor